MSDRYLVIIVYGPAGMSEGTGQLPEPNRVQEFVKLLNSYQVQPVIYLVDPAFKNPSMSDQRLIDLYHQNVIIVPDKMQDFLAHNQQLPRQYFHIAYVFPYDLLTSDPGYEWSDNLDSPNRLYYREPGRKRFDPFDILIFYDPISNRYNREIWHWTQGGHLPNIIIYGDAAREYFNLMYDIGKIKSGINISKQDLVLKLYPFVRDNFSEYASNISENIDNIKLQVKSLFFSRYKKLSYYISYNGTYMSITYKLNYIFLLWYIYVEFYINLKLSSDSFKLFLRLES